MFFQPPPRSRQGEPIIEPRDSAYQATNTQTIRVTDDQRNNSANYGRSDTSDPVYIQTSSVTIYQNNSRGNISDSSSQTIPTSLGTESAKQSGVSRGLPENQGTGNKRGTIIASAYSSASRSHVSRQPFGGSNVLIPRSNIGQHSSACQLRFNIDDTLGGQRLVLLSLSTLFQIMYIHNTHFNHAVTFCFS